MKADGYGGIKKEKLQEIKIVIEEEIGQVSFVHIHLALPNVLKML